MTEPALTIEGLTKDFGRTRALDDVSFQVPARTISGLLGPNGAGKTTLFSLVAGFLHADRGDIRVLGLDARRTSRLRGRLSILPQDALFQRNVPILDQLVFFRRLDGRSPDEARRDALEALDRVGLAEEAARKPAALSHGMTKRLGIAQAFLGHPEVILLDEPTSGLDPKSAFEIRALIRSFGERATVVVSSHNLAEVRDLCEHVAVLDKGRLVASGPVSELTRFARKLDITVSRELTEQEIDALAQLGGIERPRRLGPARYEILLQPEASDDAAQGVEAADALAAQVLRRLLDSGAVPHALRTGQTLEEFFLTLTARDSEPPS